MAAMPTPSIAARKKLIICCWYRMRRKDLRFLLAGHGTGHAPILPYRCKQTTGSAAVRAERSTGAQSENG